MTSIQRIRVPAGFLFALLYLYFCQPSLLPLLLGGSLAAAGLVLRLWASGHIEKGRRLATQGPYGWTRNPLYLGSFLMGLGFSLASSVPWLMGLFILLFLGIYLPVIWLEEREMLEAFGQEYLRYRQRVSLFLPRHPSPSRQPPKPNPGADRNFQWRRVILNREHRSVVGVLLLAAIVLLKTLWR